MLRASISRELLPVFGLILRTRPSFAAVLGLVFLSSFGWVLWVTNFDSAFLFHSIPVQFRALSDTGPRYRTCFTIRRRFSLPAWAAGWNADTVASSSASIPKRVDEKQPTTVAAEDLMYLPLIKFDLEERFAFSPVPYPLDEVTSRREDILVKVNGTYGRRLVVFNSDNHQGTAADISSMVIARGGYAVSAHALSHQLYLTMDGSYRRNPMDIFHREWLDRKSKSRLVWAGLSNPLSPHITGDAGNSSHLPEVQRQVFQYYRDDATVSQVDAFICAFPSALCEQFFSFNKTVIFAPGLRFSMWRCTKKLWMQSVRILQRAARSRKPRHYVLAMSRYDAEYINYFTGLQPLPLYSSSGGYVPKDAYRPFRKEILIGPLALRRESLHVRGTDVDFFMELVNQKEVIFATAADLYGNFRLSQLGQHRAAVLLPYSVMAYGMTELYALGIPLFVPSMKLMRQRPTLYPNDRTMTGINKTYEYCGKSHGIVPRKHPASRHPFSPESLTEEAKFYWLRFADFYQWPHITYFDSIPDLLAKLESADLPLIHCLMMVENAIREEALDKTWQAIASSIRYEPRSVPKKFKSMDEFLAK